MAQRILEPLLTTVTEGVSTSVLATLVLTPSVPLATLGFPPFVSGGPLRPVGPGQVYAPPDPIIKAALVTSVVIPVFGSSIHAAKARVHRSESGSLLTGVSEKEDLTRKHLKKEKGEDKTN